MTLREIAGFAASALKTENVRFYGGGDRIIRSAGICAGSGMYKANYAETARLGCDVHITGDVKYHDALDALDLGIAALDITHEAGEWAAMPPLADKIANALGVKTYLSK
jgi:putative NIF3 family GTP cyclohydrolase 1 type 2